MKRVIIILLISLISYVACNENGILGCTDSSALNYDPAAVEDDGSCTYDEDTLSPVSGFVLSDSLAETSGLILFDEHLWTHNDNDDTNLYLLDTISGGIVTSLHLSGILNTDWEEISQDEDYIYIGDIGNNQSGNRKDLKILRINKNNIRDSSVLADSISFFYSDQDSYDPAGVNNTDFDCEAFIVSRDSIYLFTKQWKSNKTSMYSLSKSPGNHKANLRFSFNVRGLITGAALIETKKMLALCGYTDSLDPFIYLFYDFNGSDYFGGKIKKINLTLPFHQVEGIASKNGKKIYISNEKLVYPPFINISAKLHVVDIEGILK